MPTKQELLEEKTVKELKQMARDKELSRYSNKKKAELMDLILDNYTKTEIQSWSGKKAGARGSPEKAVQGACSECGGELRPGAKFCTKCGARITVESEKTKREKKEVRRDMVKVEYEKVDNWSDELENVVVARVSTDKSLFEVAFAPIGACINWGRDWIDNIEESNPISLSKHVIRWNRWYGGGELEGRLGDDQIGDELKKKSQEIRQEIIKHAKNKLAEAAGVQDEEFAYCVMALIRFGVLPYEDREIDYSVRGVKKILKSESSGEAETLAGEWARVYGTKDFRIGMYSHITSMMMEPSKPETEAEAELMERLPEGLVWLKDLREGPDLDTARELSGESIEEVKKAVEEKTVDADFMMRAECENRNRKALKEYLEDVIAFEGAEFLKEYLEEENK